MASPGMQLQFNIHRVPTPFLLKNFRDLESWNVLGNDADGRFWLQIDMFLQTKIAIIDATRYVLWAAGMPKMVSRLGLWGSLQRSPDHLVT